MENQKYKELLIEWGVESFYNNFQEENITDESFLLLDEESIKSLFPKKGPYLLFKTKFTNFINERQEQNLSRSDAGDTASCSANSTSSTINLEEELSSSESPADILGDIFGEKSNHTYAIDSAGFLIPEEPPKKRIKYSSSVFTNYKSLVDLLNDSGADGKSLLAKKNKLTPDLRQKLVNIVINELVRELLNTEAAVGIKAETFVKVAQDIVKLFPNETVETYYSPYVSGKGGLRRQPARGKLWSRFLSLKAQLRTLSKDENKTIESDEQPEDFQDFERSSLEFLRTNIDPFPKVLQSWENCIWLDSEYLRFKSLKNSNKLILPEEYVVGEHQENACTSNSVVSKNHTAQIIPLHNVLKNYFEIPGIFNETIQYMEKLGNENCLSNIIQTRFWKDKIKKFRDKDTIFPLYVYFDEFESGNPLGSHAGIHKLGAVYCSVPIIPIQYQSLLENIFLCNLFHSADLKQFGSKIIFSKLIQECNMLEKEGINITLSDRTMRIYFCVALVLGDNLGLNSILGFVESFRANLYCRFCRSPRVDTEKLVLQKNDTLRNLSNYDCDLKKDKLALTGIKEPCVFNSIESFHVTENYAVDISHDIFEGIAEFDVSQILYQFVIIDKYFSLDTMNSHIKYFNFGKGNINKPPLISMENLKKKKIKMSCSEMKTFVLYFGLMFGSLIPHGNVFWNLYLLLRKMLAIILQSSYSIDMINNLTEVIKDHHNLYIELFKLPLKPKHHNLIHYPHIMRNVGPLTHLSSLRYESKHRELKMNANIVASRVNITRTLAVKHQLKLCNRFVSQKGFKNDNCQIGKTILHIESLLPDFYTVFTSSPKPQYMFENFVQKVTTCKSYYIGNKSYQLDDIIMINTWVLPVFGIIKMILANEQNKVCFIFNEILTYSFDDHFFGYKVRTTTNKRCVLSDSIIFQQHLNIVQKNSEEYITIL